MRMKETEREKRMEGEEGKHGELSKVMRVTAVNIATLLSARLLPSERIDLTSASERTEL